MKAMTLSEKAAARSKSAGGVVIVAASMASAGQLMWPTRNISYQRRNRESGAISSASNTVISNV